MLSRSLEMSLAIPSSPDVARAYFALAELAYTKGNRQEACIHLKEAASWASRIGDTSLQQAIAHLQEEWNCGLST
jgi:hypothetical protein